MRTAHEPIAGRLTINRGELNDARGVFLMMLIVMMGDFRNCIAALTTVVMMIVLNIGYRIIC